MGWSICLKAGALTGAEWEVVRQHPAEISEMLQPIGYPRRAAEGPVGHHERWDGSGYPRGLQEEQILLAARITAAADVWESLRAPRP